MTRIFKLFDPCHPCESAAPSCQATLFLAGGTVTLRPRIAALSAATGRSCERGGTVNQLLISSPRYVLFAAVVCAIAGGPGCRMVSTGRNVDGVRHVQM